MVNIIQQLVQYKYHKIYMIIWQAFISFIMNRERKKKNIFKVPLFKKMFLIERIITGRIEFPFTWNFQINVHLNSSPIY